MMRGLAVILSHLSPGNFLHPDDPRMAANWHGPVPAREEPRFVLFEVEVCGRTETTVKICPVGDAGRAAWVSIAEVEIAPVIGEDVFSKRSFRYRPGILNPGFIVHQATLPAALAKSLGWRC